MFCIPAFLCVGRLQEADTLLRCNADLVLIDVVVSCVVAGRLEAHWAVTGHLAGKCRAVASKDNTTCAWWGRCKPRTNLYFVLASCFILLVITHNQKDMQLD